MGLWNKIIVSLLALFLIVSALITLLVATEAVAPDFLPGGSYSPDGALVQASWFQPQLEDLAAYSGPAEVTTIAISIAVAAVMLAVLVMELGAGQRAVSLLISIAGDGGLSIDEDSVRYLAERTGLSNRQVMALRCRVQVQGRRSLAPARVVITCFPRVNLGSNIQEVRDDLSQRIKETVEELTGLQVLRVDVARVRYDKADTAKLMGG